jgi:hypothetical protein
MRAYKRNRQSRILVVLFALVVIIGTGVVLFGLLVGPASAQPVEDPRRNQTATPTPNGERIESGVVLLETSYRADTGMGTFKVRVKDTTALTLTDAGEFYQGGKLTNSRTEVLQPGTHTLEIPLTEVKGMVGAEIKTKNTRYAEIIREFQFNRDPVDYQTAQILVLLAGAGGAGFTYRVVRNRYDDEDDWYRRVL